MASVEFTDNSDEARRQLDSAIQRALEKCGLVAEGYAKLICPVDTGRLRNSISHAVRGRDAYIGTNVEYAPYVEMGTRKQKAQPFLKPAAENHAAEYNQIIKTELSKG